MFRRMFRRRSDLPIETDPTARFLPWLIAFMVFLAALSIAGSLALTKAVARWDRAVAGTLTVEIPPAALPLGTAQKEAGKKNAGQESAGLASDGKRRDAVLTALGQLSAVASVHPLEREEIVALVEPWLGPVEQLTDLPLPQLIDVALTPGAGIDAAALETRLRAVVPDVSVEDHGVWLGRLTSAGRAVRTMAIAVLALISVAMIASVMFVTRTNLAIHREVIDVLHLVGARDAYVARQFADRAMALGFRGGLIGLGLALPALLVLNHVAQDLRDGLLPDLSLSPAHWAVIVLLPPVVALIARWTARVTVLRSLARMP